MKSVFNAFFLVTQFHEECLPNPLSMKESLVIFFNCTLNNRLIAKTVKCVDRMVENVKMQMKS